MITLQDKELKRYEADLKTFAHRAYPFATRFTIHKASVRGRELAVERARNVMVLKNKHTERSIQYFPSSANKMTLNVGRQEAFVGSTEDYMEDQEFGATKTSTGKEGHSIPTSWAANQDGANPRTAVPKGARATRNIRLPHRDRRGKTKKQRNLVAAAVAIKTGQRYAFMEFGKTKGIFRVIGGSKRQKRGWPNGMRLKMAYDLSRKSITIPPHAWLRPAVLATQMEIPTFYRDALLFQLRRRKMFDY